MSKKSMCEIITDELCFRWAKVGLSVENKDDRWIFSSITGCLVVKQLIIDYCGNYDVKVYGNSICANNEFYKSAPLVIEGEKDFYFVVNQFSSWQVCAGNEMLNNVFDDTIISIRAFVCSISNTIRSRSCELLINKTGSIRCKECRLLLSRIRKLKYTKPKERTTNEAEEGESHQNSGDQFYVEKIEASDEDLLQLNKTATNSIINHSPNFDSVESNDFISDQEPSPADFLSVNIIEYS